MKPYREWLPATAAGSLGGSFYSEDVTDYYMRPEELGYGKIVALDHEFIGRGALERRTGDAARKKVTLVWNSDDVTTAIGGLFQKGKKVKYIDLPKSRYALYHVDAVMRDGQPSGVSLDCGYITNEEAYVSLASLDAASCEPGTEVVVLWGEEPNSTKPQVEPHEQVEIRATVAPAPYVDFARTAYRAG